MAPILRVVHFRWIRVLFTLKEEKCPSTKGQMKTNRQNRREKNKNWMSASPTKEADKQNYKNNTRWCPDSDGKVEKRVSKHFCNKLADILQFSRSMIWM
jgi:hypothetical protein